MISVIEHYSKQLYRFVRGRVRTNEDAEDILQDIWYQFSSLANADALESVSGWLYRVARNRITDRSRKKQEAMLDDYLFTDSDGDAYFNERLLADSDSPEDAYMKDVFWEALFEALDELPEKQRMVFVQNELEDQTLQDIADTTDEPLKTIISRKRYAVQHLRARLSDLYQDFIY